MKSPEKRLFTIIFLFSLFFRLFSTENSAAVTDSAVQKVGFELCDYVNSQLVHNGIKTSTQPLVSNGLNYFPYNIIIENIADNRSSASILLYFSMEDAYNFETELIEIIKALSTESFNSTIVISYGDGFPLKNDFIVSGIQAFTASLNTNITYYAFAIKLSAEHNGIISGSGGTASPSWMVKAAFSTFAKQKIREDIPRYYLSQFSKYTFLHDEILSSFFATGTQAIRLNLKKDINHTDFIRQLVQNYSKETKKTLDYHSLMFRIFKHTVWLSEYTIVRLIIFTIFLSLIYTFTIGLLNSNLKNVAWRQIKTNWYTLPITFQLSSGGFFLGKAIYLFFSSRAGGMGTVYGIFILQILISSLFVSLFFLLELFFRRTYGERSLDFLIMISSFVNQYLFCLFDISLYPFFLLLCLLAILAIILKRNWTHIVLFILTILVFIPYIIGLYKFSDLFSLRQFFLSSWLQNLSIPLILLPFYMMLLRIFTATKKRFTQKKVFFIIVSATYVFFFLVLFVLNAILFSYEPVKKENIITENIRADDSLLKVSYSDRKVFSDIIRTINLDFGKQPESVVFYVQDENKPAVLYSDNDFKTANRGKTYFTLPPRPPKNLTFTYGTQSTSSKIYVELIYLSDDNKYYCCTKELSTRSR